MKTPIPILALLLILSVISVSAAPFSAWTTSVLTEKAYDLEIAYGKVADADPNCIDMNDFLRTASLIQIAVADVDSGFIKQTRKYEIFYRVSKTDGYFSIKLEAEGEGLEIATELDKMPEGSWILTDNGVSGEIREFRIKKETNHALQRTRMAVSCPATHAPR